MVTLAARELGVTLGNRSAVRDLSAAFEAGTLVGVLGANGAGKSSFVRALLGLLPHRGSVEIDGVARTALSRESVARSIAYLPQSQTLHWPLTVERVVALGRIPHLAPFSRVNDGDRVAIEHAMKRTEVAHLRNRTATELSGGERARVMLARALAVEAPILIVDEPLASLDPAHQIEGMELLRSEADAGALVLAVLHDLSLAVRFCDRVLVLAEGELVADGPPLDVLNADLLARVYGITAFFGDAETPMLVPLARIR